jgi:hypothetical protein
MDLRSARIPPALVSHPSLKEAMLALFVLSIYEFVRDRRRTFVAMACITLFFATLSRYWVSYAPTDSVIREPESFRLAHSLYETGKFSNPFAALDTGPSAHLSPVFPSFVAMLMKLFGDGSTGIFAIRLATELILAFQLALYPVFSRILGMGEMNGIIAASIWIVAKPRIVHNHEELYVAILLAIGCCGYRRYLDEEAQGRRRLTWFLGGLMGCSIPYKSNGRADLRHLAGLGAVASQIRVFQEVPSALGSVATFDHCSLDASKLFDFSLFHPNT